MINEFLRTAIFKKADKSVLLVKISLPSIKSDEYTQELKDCADSFYRELCELYMRSGSDAVSTQGEQLISHYSCPLTFSVTWRGCDAPYGRGKQRFFSFGKPRRLNGEGKAENYLCLERTEKLYNRDGIIKSRSIIDIFDKKNGFLIK